MNDENFYQKKVVPNEAFLSLHQNDHQRSGLRFARRIRLPRAVGLGGMFFPIASVLVAQPITGGWWLLLVGWAFVWPHLAWQWASKADDPLHSEFTNLKVDRDYGRKPVAIHGAADDYLHQPDGRRRDANIHRRRRFDGGFMPGDVTVN